MKKNKNEDGKEYETLHTDEKNENLESPNNALMEEDNGEEIDTIRQRKSKKHPQHQSKGLALIQKKISMLNRLYKTNIKLSHSDLKDHDPPRHGTVASISIDLEAFSDIAPSKEIS